MWRFWRCAFGCCGSPATADLSHGTPERTSPKRYASHSHIDSTRPFGQTRGHRFALCSRKARGIARDKSRADTTSISRFRTLHPTSSGIPSISNAYFFVSLRIITLFISTPALLRIASTSSCTSLMGTRDSSDFFAGRMNK